MPALILDCDGVLAETEGPIHLPAFNLTFAEFGLPFRWTSGEYAEKLRIAGGRERFAASLTPEVLAALGLPVDSVAVEAFAERVHRRKIEIVAEILSRRPPPARPGIVRILRSAHDAGWKLAVASTAAEASVRRVVDGVIGPAIAGDLLILAGDVVSAKKPDPEIYELAVQRLRVPKTETVVIEDSGNGLAAARAAGLPCVITVSEYTTADDFTGSPLVLSSLGDAEHPMRVIANRSGISPAGQLTLNDLEALALGHGQGAPTPG